MGPRIYLPCVPGSECQNNKCTMKNLPMGSSCSDCELCSYDYVCEDGTCQNFRDRKIPVCRGCGPGKRPCVSGSECRDGKCTAHALPLGSSCSDCKLCEYGHTCKDGTCHAPAIACGGHCSIYNPGSVCEDGLICWDAICKNLKVDEGHSCANDCEECQWGLVCEYGLCKGPPI
jgi:hypothetical protein